MRGLGRGTGAVVDTELQAGIRVHVGVRGEPTWSKHDGPRAMQCPLSRGPRRPRGPRFSGTPGSNAGTPPLSALRLQCNKRTPRRVVDSPHSAHLPRDATTHSSNAVAWPARWPRTALPHARWGLIGPPSTSGVPSWDRAGRSWTKLRESWTRAHAAKRLRCPPIQPRSRVRTRPLICPLCCMLPFMSYRSTPPSGPA